jgi:hypothetical protein
MVKNTSLNHFKNHNMESIIIIIAIAIVLFLISWLEDIQKKPLTNPYLSLIINHIKIKGGNMAEMTTTQQVKGKLQPVDRLGAPAPVQAGSVSFSSSNETVIVPQKNPDDELEVTVVAKGPGTAELSYSADADLGEGVVTITGKVVFLIQPAQAAGFGIIFGAPEEQPAPAE